MQICIVVMIDTLQVRFFSVKIAIRFLEFVEAETNNISQG